MIYDVISRVSQSPGIALRRLGLLSTADLWRTRYSLAEGADVDCSRKSVADTSGEKDTREADSLTSRVDTSGSDVSIVAGDFHRGVYGDDPDVESRANQNFDVCQSGAMTTGSHQRVDKNKEIGDKESKNKTSIADCDCEFEWNNNEDGDAGNLVGASFDVEGAGCDDGGTLDNEDADGVDTMLGANNGSDSRSHTLGYQTQEQRPEDATEPALHGAGDSNNSSTLEDTDSQQSIGFYESLIQVRFV